MKKSLHLAAGIFTISVRSIMWMFIISVFSLKVIKRIKPPDLQNLSSNVAPSNTTPKVSQTNEVLELLSGVAVEEIIFRFFPFSILLVVLSLIGKKDDKILFWVVGILFSAIFGILHGNYLNIFIQGIGGIILWNLMGFIYYGLLERNRYLAFLGTFVIVTLVHFMFDAILIWKLTAILYGLILTFMFISIARITQK